jgi:hypothetical protein
MAFCNHCGAQLEGDERFCVKCGNDVKAQAAAPAAAVSAPAAAPAAPIPVAQPAAPPPMYAAPGQFPVAMAVPPPAQSKHGWIWGVIIVALVLYGLYYMGTHNKQTPQSQPGQGQGQPGQGQPGQPGQGQPGQGQPGQPGVNPGQAPGQGQGGDNSALVRLQEFAGTWIPVNGNVEVSKAIWRNNSNVTILSATLQCNQFASNGASVTSLQTTLNGPVNPHTTWVASGPFQMGAISPYESRINCAIVGVNPAGN